MSGYEQLVQSLVRVVEWNQLFLFLVNDKCCCKKAETHHQEAKEIYPEHRSSHSVLIRLKDRGKSHPLALSAHREYCGSTSSNFPAAIEDKTDKREFHARVGSMCVMWVNRIVSIKISMSGRHCKPNYFYTT